MTVEDLVIHLTEDKSFSYDDIRELEKRQIDGKAFLSLTREDFAIIYPNNQQFLLGSNLYKLSMKARMPERGGDTQSLLDEMSDLDDSHSFSSHPSHASTPCSSNSSVGGLRKRPAPPAMMPNHAESSVFKLPIFSPDLKQCIEKDAFYTPAQRNKLIKESCLALRGYCWEREKNVTNEEKRSLAKSLLQLAPKSLGDSHVSSPEALLYGQIVRWFQNHAYLDKRHCEGSVSKKKRVSAASSSDMDDDVEAIQSHMKELEKELKRNSYDETKVARLLSLTFTTRRSEMLSQRANVRIMPTLQKYPCFKKPIFLIQEMYHDIGVRFATMDDVKQKARSLQNRWDSVVAPALVKYAVENGRYHPESDDVNVVTMYCLNLLVDKLKSKGGPSAAKKLDSLICVAPTLEEALDENIDNEDPYIICVGTISAFTSSVGVCKKKVITSPIGQMAFSALLTLMAIYYTYDLEYHSPVKQVLHFIQEKVIQHPLSPKTRPTTAYMNLYRAVNCIEQRHDLEKETQPDQVLGQTEMGQETQLFCDFC